MKHKTEEELQISDFIKQPTSLKLLILAGTSIKSSQLVTVARCSNLIKLDLSANQLVQVPLEFQKLPFLKILYLHDNAITDIVIKQTCVEYISLFNNPIKNYRKQLIDKNHNLIGIDHNIVCRAQRRAKVTPKLKSSTEIKWPIVEISQNLEQEEDYLNLLKAEIFVISQIYRKVQYTDTVNTYIQGMRGFSRYNKIKAQITDENWFFNKDKIAKIAKHWIEFTKRKRRMRQILIKKGKQHLLMNRLDSVKYNRNPKVSSVIERFLTSVRQRMKARGVFQRNLRAYRNYTPVYQFLIDKFIGDSDFKKLYFKDSEFLYLQKIFLYAKRKLFKEKNYDLCDNFDSLIQKSGKQYYILRNKQGQASNERSFIKRMISQTIRMVVIERGQDKRHILYNKKGHKRIQIKSVGKIVNPDQIQEINQKAIEVTRKINRLYNSYDKIVEYKFQNEDLYRLIMRIIRYFNAGNTSKIVSNPAAYFQTEVIFEKEEQIKPSKFYVCVQAVFQRIRAANTIQKFWRKILSTKKSSTKVIQQIKYKKAYKLSNRWLRGLTFSHRSMLNKYQSFIKSVLKERQIYMQLEVYMNMPCPTDFLRYYYHENHFKSKQDLYFVLTHNTEVEIVEMFDRSWIKIRFASVANCYSAIKLFSILTYRYYFNGFFIKLFTFEQAQRESQLLTYENRLEKLFKIKINKSTSIKDKHRTSKKIDVDNANPFFVWTNIEENTQYTTLFKIEDIKNLPISVYIYNRNKRPLKVNCDMLWMTNTSLYKNKKAKKLTMRIKTPVKDRFISQHEIPQLPHIRHKMKRQRQNSMKEHKSLLKSRRKGMSERLELGMLSETLNIKKKNY